MRDLRRFRTHLQILKHSHPEIVVQLAPEPPPAPVEVAMDGEQPLLKWKGKCLHSPKSPDAEAVRLINSVVFEPGRVYVMFGVGLGHLVNRALEKLPPRAALILFEPDYRVLREILAAEDFRPILYDARVSWVTGAKWREHLSIILRRVEKEGMRPSTSILSLPAYRDYFQPALSATRTLMAQFMNERDIDTQTRKTLTDLWNRNLTANIPYLLESTPLKLLTTTFKDVPFVLVGAGPSLDDNLDILPALKSRALIVAVDTALAPLLSAGCDPDIVIAMDAQEANAGDFSGLQPHSALLAYDAFCFPSIPPLYPADRRIATQTGHVFSDIDDVVVVKNGLLPLFDHLVGGECGFLQNGGSVITGAFDLARISGCSAIGIVGVDMSVPGYLSHSKRTNKYRDMFSRQSRFDTPETECFTGIAGRGILRLDGEAGKEVPSDRVLVMYKHWMEDAAAKCKIPCYRIGPHKGAKMAGYAAISPEQFISLHGADRAGIEARLKRCRGAAPAIDASAVGLRINEFRGDLDRLDHDTAMEKVGPFELDRFVSMASFEIADRLRSIIEIEPESEHLIRRQQAARAVRQWVHPFLDKLEETLR